MPQHWELYGSTEGFLHKLCDSTGSFAAALKAFFTTGRQHWELCHRTKGSTVGPAIGTALKAVSIALRQAESFSTALKSDFTALRQHWGAAAALKAFFNNFTPTLRQH